MADLQLIGAVGVKVRPDTDGFRNEAKREIMAQLRDIEGDMRINVQPKVNAGKVGRDLVSAIDNQVVEQEIDFRLKLNDDDLNRQLRQLSRMKVPDLKSVRIKLDSKAAEESLSSLASELEDITADMTRLPNDLGRLTSDMTKTFQALDESMSGAKSSLSNYTDELSNSSSKLEEHRESIKKYKDDELQTMTELARAQAAQQQALEDLQLARENVANAQNAEVRKQMRIEREAAKESEKIAREKVTAIERTLSATRKSIRTEETLIKRVTTEQETLNSKIKQQNEIIKDLERTETSRRKSMGEEKRLLEEQIEAHKERQQIIEEEIKQTVLLQNARAKTDTQLRSSIGGAGRSWRDYADAVRRNATLATSYMDFLARKSSSSTDQQVADLAELEQRIREAARRRAEMMQAEAELSVKQAQNDFGVWDETRMASGWEQQLNRAKSFADQAERYIERKRPTMRVTTTVDPTSAAAADAELEALARDRVVNYRTSVTGSTLALSGDDFNAREMRVPVRLFASNLTEFMGEVAGAFSGVAFARRLQGDLADAVKEFDQLAIAATTAGMKIGGIAALGAGALGFTATLADDLTELTALLLLTPAALTTLASAVYVTAKGFDQFNAAVDGDADALATFGENGQAAARSLGILRRELNERIKPAFWEGIGEDLTNMSEAIRGPVLRGMVAAAEEVGAAWGGIFRAMETFADSGDMDAAFDNMIEGLEGVSNATEPLFNALNDIGLAGSRWLPNFGQWAQRNAEAFRDWADEAERTGEMDQWIEQSLNHMDSLASVTADSVRIIDSLGAAAERAGYGGLASLANAMSDVSDAMQGEFFQRNATNIFRGALEGIEELAVGMGEFGEAVLEQSRFIEDAFESIGTIGGNVFSGLADAMNNPRMLSGVTEFLSDIEEATANLGPLFDKIANGIGDTARLSGEMIKGVLEIADAFATVWDQSTELTEAMEKLIPVVTDVVAGMIEIARVPLGVLMDSLAVIIELFVAMPGPVQALVASLGAMALLAPKFRQLGDVIRNFADSFRVSENAIGGWRNTWATAMGTMSDSGRIFMENSRQISAMDRSIARAAFSWRDAMGQFRTAADSIKGSLNPVETQAKRLATSGIPQLQASLVNLQRTQDTFRRSAAAGLIDTAQAESRIASLGSRIQRLQMDIADRSRQMGLEMGNNISQGVERGTANMGMTVGQRLRDAFRMDSRGFFAPIEASAQQTATRTEGIFRQMMVAIRSAMSADTAAGGLEALPASLQGAVRETDNLTRSTRNLSSALAATRVGGMVTGLGQLVTATVTARNAIGAGAGAGLRAALSGLSGALGGPWGVALVAGAAALTAFGMAAAEQRQRIDSLMGTFDELGNSTSATVDKLASDMNTAKASFLEFDLRAFIGGAETAGETLQKLGTTSREVADWMVNDRAKYDQFVQALADVEKGGFKSKEGLQALSDLMGVPVTAGMIPDLNNLKSVLDEMDVSVQGAGTAFTTLNGQVAPVSQTSKDLAEAFGRMADEAGSAEDRVSGLQDALAILNGDEIAAEDAIQRMNENISSLGESLSTTIPAMENWGDAINDSTGKIETSAPAAQRLRTEMKGMVEDALLVGESTEDMSGALQRGKDAFLESARAAGASEDELRLFSTAWDHLAGGTPDEVEKIAKMSVEGAESIEKAEAIMNKFGVEWDNQEFVSWLTADTTQAEIAGKTAEEIAQMWADKEAKAQFGVDTHMLETGIQTAEAKGLEWDAAEFKAALDADPELAKLATQDAQGAVDQFLAGKYVAKLEGDAELFKTAKAEAEELGLDFNEKDFIAFLKANAEEFYSEMTPVDQIVERFRTEEAMKKLEAENATAAGIGGAELSVAGWKDTPAAKALEAVDSTAEGIALAVGSVGASWLNENFPGTLSALSMVDEGIGQAVGAVGAQWLGSVFDASLTARADVAAGVATAVSAATTWTMGIYDAALTARSDVAIGVATAIAGVQSWTTGIYAATLTATANVAAGVATAVAGVQTWVAGVYQATLTAASGVAAGIATAAGAITAWATQVWAATLTAIDSTGGGISGARAAITAWASQVYQATLTAVSSVAAGIAQAAASITAWATAVYNATLTAVNSTMGGIGQATASIMAWANATYNATLTAINSVANGISMARAAISVFTSALYQAALTAETSGVSNALAIATQIGRGWAMQVFTATLTAVASAFNADGNLFPTVGELAVPVRAFADGGFDLRQARRLANKAGRENHRAQIAQPKTPYRIWAEPETGGEAYIPLAVSKRARSTKIWEETGNRLGVNVEEYAQGGIRAGRINSDPSANGAGGGYAGPGIHIEQTINYPVAEPASTSTNRGLQLAAALI